MLIGFGFLISYLRFHRWMSLGITLFIAAIASQIYLLFSAFWNKSFNEGWLSGYAFRLINVIGATKASIAVMISYGALLGKIDLF